MNAIDLSVVVPMFNEQEIIPRTIREIVKELTPLAIAWELVLVDDGSGDDTLAICRRAQNEDPRIRVVTYPHNRGRGYALRTGFQVARGGTVVTIDADLSYSPEHISLIWRELGKGEADIVIGSPYMPGGRAVGVPFSRLLISRLGNSVLRYVFPGRIRTLTGILRGYHKEVLEAISLDSQGKEIHLEILSKALALGYRVKEVPAVLRGRSKGRSKFKFSATTISHLLFSVYQKPMIIFGFFGLSLVLGGLGIGVFVVIKRFQHSLNPTRPIITLMILMIVAGVQMFSFGFLANQIGIIKKELYKIQKIDRSIERKVGKED